MPNYLTKEEIRQWRSSLEKITLEEFAARLGKEVEEGKPTNDVVDIVKTRGTSSNTDRQVADGFSKIAERAFVRERQISHTPFSINRKDFQLSHKTNKQSINKEISVSKNVQKSKTQKKLDNIDNANTFNLLEDVHKKNEAQFVFKKALTDREQLVFDYFYNNIGKTVFAKDLASLLDLPRDYVYKYIKNLRAKIEGEKLRNVPSGGFVLVE